MRHLLSFSVRNATARPRTLHLEPWARQFLMAPDEKLEIVAGAETMRPSVRLVEAGGATLVYTTRYDRVWVIQEGITHELATVYAPPPVPVPSASPREDPLWDRDLDG